MDIGLWASWLRWASIALLLLAAISGAGAYYFERQLQRQKDKKIAELEALQPRELSEQQEQLLGRLYWYLGKFQAKKLVIGRDGRLHAVEPGHQELTDVNLAGRGPRQGKRALSLGAVAAGLPNAPPVEPRTPHPSRGAPRSSPRSACRT